YPTGTTKPGYSLGVKLIDTRACGLVGTAMGIANGCRLPLSSFAVTSTVRPSWRVNWSTTVTVWPADSGWPRLAISRRPSLLPVLSLSSSLGWMVIRLAAGAAGAADGLAATDADAPAEAEADAEADPDGLAEAEAEAEADPEADADPDGLTEAEA